MNRINSFSCRIVFFSAILVIPLFFLSPGCSPLPFNNEKSSSDNPKKIISLESAQTDYSEIEKYKDEISLWLVKNTRRPAIPSSAVVIVKYDTTIFKKAVNTSLNRTYPIFSFTKTFTALAVLQLYEKGLLKLDDPVSKYLGVKFETEGLNSAPITIRHLLAHTSGLADRGKFKTYELNPDVRVPAQIYPAGFEFSYSNAGYNILGVLVKKISGIPLRIYITDNILKPLEMNDSTTLKTMAGSSGLICSINDLTNYIKMLLMKGKFNGKRIIKEETFNEIFNQSLELPPAEYTEYRGISWRIQAVENRTFSMSHASLWFGSGGWIHIFPTLGVGYVFISNPPHFKLEKFNRFYNNVKYKMLHFTRLLSKNDINPLLFKPTLPDKSLLEKYSGNYENLISKSLIKVRLYNNHLVIDKYHKIRNFKITPTTVNKFTYRRKAHPSILVFDFLWKDKKVKGLAARDGYYIKIN